LGSVPCSFPGPASGVLLAIAVLQRGLMGWRKLTIGDPDWRVVWRSATDPDSTPIIEVAEVWAVGACSDGEVYEEMMARGAAMPRNPRASALAEVRGN